MLNFIDENLLLLLIGSLVILSLIIPSLSARLKRERIKSRMHELISDGHPRIVGMIADKIGATDDEVRAAAKQLKKEGVNIRQWGEENNPTRLFIPLPNPNNDQPA
jgi:hypothetical protein